jgi:hypothetical protein
LCTLRPVRRVFCFFLSFWLLLGGFLPHGDMEELAKIPVLIQHYLEHKAEAHGNLSFKDFLLTHYKDLHAQSKPDSAHENLPFFKHTIPAMVFFLPVFKVNFKIGFVLLPRSEFPEPENKPFGRASDPWQPPQSA